MANFMIMMWLPNNPGLSAVFAMMGICLSPVIMGNLIHYEINPDDISADIVIQEGLKSVNYFNKTISDEVPLFWLTLAGIQAIFTIVGP
jgi:hypothetical protein